MIAAREDAKKKREEEQKEREEEENGEGERHPLDEIMTEVDLEKKRKANPSMTWKGRRPAENESTRKKNYYVKRQKRFIREADDRMTGNVPTLFRICVDVLVEHFDSVEALGNVDSSIRRSICESLVASGKMNGAAFDSLAESGMESLELVDCAEVTQDQLATSLESLVPAGLRALILNHSGRCFGPKAVNAIISCADVSSLFAISIGGAYLLTDTDASSLIKATARTLSSIEFRASPLLGKGLLDSISTNFSSSCSGTLMELSLEDINVSKDSLLALGSSTDALRNLKSLSLRQIGALDDEVMASLLDPIDGSLEGIDLSDNVLLTDDSLSCIRRCNKDGQLRALRLSGLKSLSAAGLEAFFTHNIPGLPNPPMLRKLDLSSCEASAVTDVVLDLAATASSMKKLPDSNVSGPTVSMGVSTMGGLVFVNISGSAVTDTGMESLAATSFSSLLELDVSFCSQISDKGLGYLVSKVHDGFSKLHVWGCAQLTDEFHDGHSRVDERGLEIVGVWMKNGTVRSVR
eukprot:scaffold83358_cov56-Attheya_sp.AAC.2